MPPPSPQKVDSFLDFLEDQYGNIMLEVDSLLHRRQRSLKFLDQIVWVNDPKKVPFFIMLHSAIVCLDESIVCCPLLRDGEGLSSMETEIRADDVFPYAIAHRRAAEPV